MSSLVSDADKLAWAAEFGALADTFGRQCIIYKEPERVDIVTTDDYLSTYRNAHQGVNYTFDTTPISGSFQMRVQWINANQEINTFRFPIDSHVPLMVCKLKMDKDAYAFMADQQSFYVDGISCELVGAAQPHGLFGVDYYTVYARKRDMQ